MIEVEKKFKLTKDQIQDLIAEADKKLGTKEVVDSYYDYPDYRNMTRHHWIRIRNGQLEYKFKSDDKKVFGSTFNEIEGADKVFAALDLDYDDDIAVHDQLIDHGLNKEFTVRTMRESYMVGDIRIDIDRSTVDEHPEFEYEIVEAELASNDDADTEGLQKRLLDFAIKRGYSTESTPGKIDAYMTGHMPEVCKLFIEDKPRT